VSLTYLTPTTPKSFKCHSCVNYNLCYLCHTRKHHDQTHTMEPIYFNAIQK